MRRRKGEKKKKYFHSFISEFGRPHQRLSARSEYLLLWESGDTRFLRLPIDKSEYGVGGIFTNIFSKYYFFYLWHNYFPGETGFFFFFLVQRIFVLTVFCYMNSHDAFVENYLCIFVKDDCICLILSPFPFFAVLKKHASPLVNLQTNIGR